MQEDQPRRPLDEPAPQVPAADPPAGQAAARWLRFFAGLLLLWVFAFGVVPLLQRLGPVREIREATQNHAVDASALFYTECDAFAEAEASIRNAMKYSSHGAERSAPATDLRE